MSPILANALFLLFIIGMSILAGFTLRQSFVPVTPPRRTFRMTDEAIARIVHEANRAYCVNLGDFSHKAWNNAEAHVRQSAIEGVRHLRANPHLTPEQMHENWCASKLEQGYRYGPAKCHRSLTHPCLVPYHELPPHQQFKDFLFHAIVKLFEPTVA
jgi:hypothetical protein